MNMEKVVTRIAPSPTGQMHIGTVRTALFNYLYAKKLGGTYFVRIEDTDKERNKEEWVDAIWSDFAWCGLVPDARYRTSDHLARHVELLHSLVEKGTAYISKEPAKDDPTREVAVVRLKNPGVSLTFDDLIRGPVTFDTTELGDFVIARSIDDPLYHFAVVADDGDAGVTHILRAEEHISNTPRQILIQEALGLPRPQYGHLPLILAPDRAKLSKRKHGASIDNYRAQGVLPEALINYLALLGWNPGTEQEMFSMDELVQTFDLSGIHKGGAIFDIEKLKWFNRQYLQRMSNEEFIDYIAPTIEKGIGERGIPYDSAMLASIAPIIHASIYLLSEVEKAVTEGEYDFFFKDPTPDVVRIPEKKSNANDAITHLKKVLERIEPLSSCTETAVKDALWEYASAAGRGAVLWPLRYALTGRDRSPDPFVVSAAIGKESVIRRVNTAIALLEAV